MQGKRSKALRVAGKAEADEENRMLEGDLRREKEHMGMHFEQIYGFKEDMD